MTTNTDVAMPELPVALYHHAEADGTFLPSESCVCEDDVYTDNGDDDTLGVPLVRLSDALAALASKEAEIERLRDELRYIANADVVSWDDPSEFRAWAQNRARAAIIASEMQMLGSREGMGAPGGDSEGGSSFDDVDDDHDNCPF